MRAIFWGIGVLLVFVSFTVQAIRLTAPSGLGTKVKAIASNSDVLEFIHLLQTYPFMQEDTVITARGDTVLKVLEQHNQVEMLAHLHWHVNKDWSIDTPPTKNSIEEAVRSGDLESTKILTNALTWQLASSDKVTLPERAAAKFLMPALNTSLQVLNEDISNYLLEMIDNPPSYLSEAVKLNYVHLVKYITIQTPVAIEGRWLFDIASEGHVEMTRVLIEAGADVDWHAVRKSYPPYRFEGESVIEKVLDEALHAKTKGKQIDHYLEVIKILIDNGARIHRSDKKTLKKLGVEY